MPYFVKLLAPLCNMKKLPHFVITRASGRKNIKAESFGNNTCTALY